MLRQGEMRLKLAVRGLVLVGATVAMTFAGTGWIDPATAQDGAAIETPAAVARAEAHDAVEALRSEIRMLNELRDAQDALLRWNRLRAGSGEAPTALDGELCREVRHWCELLPATFGRVAGGRS